MIEKMENRAVAAEAPKPAPKPAKLHRLPLPAHVPERHWKRISAEEQHEWYINHGLAIPPAKATAGGND